jgi:hypothetical protein
VEIMSDVVVLRGHRQGNGLLRTKRTGKKESNQANPQDRAKKWGHAFSLHAGHSTTPRRPGNGRVNGA